jgi:hypothetical protein
MSKRKHLMRHAKARATQRLDINLHQNLHEQIVKDIKEGKLKHLVKQSSTRKIYEYNDEYNIVYDKARECIVTFIPKSLEIKTPKVESVKKEFKGFNINRLMYGD